MSRFQHIVLACALVAIFAMSTYPPWMGTVNRQGTKVEAPRGYAPIFSPPEPPCRNGTLCGTELDLGRLGLQFLGLASLTAFLMLLPQREKTVMPSENPPTNPSGRKYPELSKEQTRRVVRGVKQALEADRKLREFYQKTPEGPKQ